MASSVKLSSLFAMTGAVMGCTTPHVMYDTHERVVQSLTARNAVMTASIGVNFKGHRVHRFYH